MLMKRIYFFPRLRSISCAASLSSVLLMVLCVFGFNTSKAQTVFNYTGGTQTYTVTSTGTLTIDMSGAKGGALNGGTVANQGGNGGRVQCTLSVTAGQVLYINVGGVGGTSTSLSVGGAGGFNGGGNGGTYSSSHAAGGGG